MGRLVCTRLAKGVHTVRAFDLDTADFAGLPDGVTALPGDLTSASDVEAAVQGVDAVVHLAAILPPVADQQIDGLVYLALVKAPLAQRHVDAKLDRDVEQPLRPVLAFQRAS